MSYVIYFTDNTVLATDKTYKTLSAAKAAMTRLAKKGKLEREAAVATYSDFKDNIEQLVERTNLMSGKKFMEPINTPSYMSPAYESYWSM